MNSTAVRVTWTRLNEPVVDHYTVHYSRVNGGSGRRKRQVVSGTVTFPASASSGVVSGLQEGQQYQFSVSVSLLIDGQTLSSTPGTPMNAMTGNMSGCSVCCYCHKVFSIVYIVNCHAALCISRVTVVPLIFRVNLLKLFPVADLEGGWGVTTPLLPRI